MPDNAGVLLIVEDGLYEPPQTFSLTPMLLRMFAARRRVALARSHRRFRSDETSQIDPIDYLRTDIMDTGIDSSVSLTADRLRQSSASSTGTESRTSTGALDVDGEGEGTNCDGCVTVDIGRLDSGPDTCAPLPETNHRKQPSLAMTGLGDGLGSLLTVLQRQDDGSARRDAQWALAWGRDELRHTEAQVRAARRLRGVVVQFIPS